MKSIVLFASVLRIILITLIISFAIIANAQRAAMYTTCNTADESAMLGVINPLNPYVFSNQSLTIKPSIK